MTVEVRAQTSAARQEPEHRQGSPRRPFRAAPMTLPMAALVLLVGLLCGLHANAFVELSPVDEMMHFDNLVRTSSPDLVPDSASPLDQETLRELACRAEHDDAWRVAPGGASCRRVHHDPQEYWWHGLNPSIGHVPVYYLLTGGVSRALRVVIPAPGLLTWSRLLGGLWSLCGCWCALSAARDLGVDRRVAAVAIALVLVLPSQLAAMTMVNPDAALFALGGALLLLVLRIRARRVSPWWMVPAAIGVMLVDPSASIALLFAVTFLVLDALVVPEGRRRALARLLPVAIAAVVAAFVTLAAWSVVVAETSHVGDFGASPQESLYRIDELPLGKVLGAEAVLALLPPTDQPHEPAELRGAPRTLFVALTKLLLVAAAVGALLRGRGTTLALAGAAVAALVVAAPMMILRNYLTSHWYYEIPNRYGLSALPVLAILLAATVTGKAGRFLLTGIAGGLIATTVVAMG